VCICGEKHDLLFTTATGKPIEPRNLKRSFDARCKKAGVRQIKIHDTRRTCGSLLAALEVHTRIAMAILRHSKMAMTMEVYTQVPDNARRPQRLLHSVAALAKTEVGFSFESGLLPCVELRGFEPLTFCMPCTAILSEAV
jgi:integrase